MAAGEGVARAGWHRAAAADPSVDDLGPDDLVPLPPAGTPPAAPADDGFDDFVRREYPVVLRLAIALCGNVHAAEDLTQETFVAARAKWPLTGVDRPEAWVRRVVANRSVSRWRRLGAEARALARLGGRREPVVELPEPDERVWAAVRRLPPAQARVVALVYVEDRAVAEVAVILGCSPDTVRTHLWRARTRLAELLGTPTGDDDVGGPGGPAGPPSGEEVGP
jgi:RNA polymerase sigma factor (sigma-70 family)